jgi:hypothetical protein
MHRTGVQPARPCRCRAEPANDGSPHGILAVAVLWRTKLVEHADGSAEKAVLVSRLARPGPLQLWWAV